MQPSLFSPSLTPTAKQLYEHQEECVQAIFGYFKDETGSPICVIPTAGGKSLCMAEFMKRANDFYPGTRFLVLSHVALLLTQNSEELLNQWPGAHITFFSDSLGQKELDGEIVFATIQSIYKKAYDFREPPDIILLDECHTLSPDNDSMYRRFFSDMKVINPFIKIVGFSATPFRAGYGMLHTGKNALFTHIAYEIGIAELIARGHLTPIITPGSGTVTKMDTTGVRMNGGDYVQSQLAKKVDDAALTKACVDELMAYGHDRKKWIVFCVDITHCEHVCEEIKSRGIDAEMVHSKMDGADCARAIDRFKNGNARCMVNVAILTTGANFPAIDLLALMRPTKSPVLYVQTVGRAMRKFPGKENALLLDFGGVVEELGPIDQVRVPEKKEGDGEAPTKICPGEFPNGNKCYATLHAATMKCPHCAYVFPDPGLNLDVTASDAAVLSSQLAPKTVAVSRVAYFRHKKEGKPDSLRIEYLCGLETYRDWWHFEHGQYPREKACREWRANAGTAPPNTITEALSRINELRMPAHISVKKIGKYHQVTGVDYDNTK